MHTNKEENYTRESMFGRPPKDALALLDNFDSILQEIKPLSSKHLQSLPYNIQQLSLQLTSERSSRKKTYMNSRVEMISYTRYFMWWNLFRLTSLFARFPKDFFQNLLQTEEETYCLDIGSGPLTLPIALYLARPELRDKKLNWYCLDPSSTSLSLGEDIFLSIVAKLRGRAWNIIKVKGLFGETIRNKAKLICSANMFNEMYLEDRRPLEELVKLYAKTLSQYTKDENASVLLVEPGIPRSARFISLFRDSLLRQNFSILSPCPHEEACPMPGTRDKKWCHFTMNAENAPEKLQKLSRDASLAKEKIVLSYVFASKCPQKNKDDSALRISSLPIRLPKQKIGHYACGKKGLMLFVKNKYTIAENAALFSGDLVQQNKEKAETKQGNLQKKRTQIDSKSGAIIIDS
jgi:ribosomal protein RSM22 (predicted rRNA methylase)